MADVFNTCVRGTLGARMETHFPGMVGTTLVREIMLGDVIGEGEFIGGGIALFLTNRKVRRPGENIHLGALRD